MCKATPECKTLSLCWEQQWERRAQVPRSGPRCTGAKVTRRPGSEDTPWSGGYGLQPWARASGPLPSEREAGRVCVVGAGHQHPCPVGSSLVLAACWRRILGGLEMQFLLSLERWSVRPWANSSPPRLETSRMFSLSFPHIIVFQLFPRSSRQLVRTPAQAGPHDSQASDCNPQQSLALSPPALASSCVCSSNKKMFFHLNTSKSRKHSFYRGLFKKSL